MHAPAGPAASPPVRKRPAQWRLSVDTSIFADSNVTNSTDERSIDTYQGGAVLPVPLDPALRAKADLGAGLGVSAGAEIELADGIWLLADAEVYAVDYGGGANDDVSLLVGAGPMLRWGEREASLQLIRFDRWYGGISASAGWGVRGRYQQQVGEGQRIILTVDGRVFETGYGDDFAGSSGGAYLSYESLLDPLTAASAGFFVRRDWIREDSYSSLELGFFGGLSRFLGPHLTGSLSGGLSYIIFDAPILYLSPDPREDWRIHASASLTTRRPIGWGVHPSIGYSYNRTRSSIGFFDADRHRLRLGLRRAF